VDKLIAYLLAAAESYTPDFALELDIDARLADLWAVAPEAADVGVLGPYRRAAFGLGYVAALRDGGRLLRDRDEAAKAALVATLGGVEPERPAAQA
jgi:hypothetical protein